MNRHDVCARIEDVGLVPVVRAPTAELAQRAVEALFEGGISIFEITLTVPDAPSLIAKLTARFADQALVGAGTVLTADEARACLDAGAQFVVSPGFDRETVNVVRARDVAMMPGGLTPTEVMTCANAGADMVKIFPCSAVGGAKYLKALKAPLPHIKLLPTGGVTVASAHEYVQAGASALGIGSELVDVQALRSGEAGVLTAKASAWVEAVRNARAAH